MKRLSEKELNHKIESFLDRKNAEVFHVHRKERVVETKRNTNRIVLKFA